MNKSRKGDVTESIILGELMKRGFSVSVPFGDNDRYDLIVDSGRNLSKCQCKTAYDHEDGGAIRFKTCSNTKVDGESVETTYESNEVDVFIVYSPTSGNVYWVPFEHTPKYKMVLRVDEVEPKAPKSRINYAESYEIDNMVKVEEKENSEKLVPTPLNEVEYTEALSW